MSDPVDPNRPRYFTDDEIDHILDSVWPRPKKTKKTNVPFPIRNKIWENNMSLAKEILEDVVLTPLAIPDLIDRLKYLNERAMIDAETPVGINAGEALAGPITQMALNAFHQSGSSKNVGSGVDQLKSLINLSRQNHPSVILRFKDPNLKIEDVLEKRKDIVAIPFSELVTGSDIDLEIRTIDRWWYKAVLDLDPDRLQGVSTSWVLRLELDVGKMMTYGIKTEHIVHTLETGHDTRVIPSSFPLGILYVYVIPSSLEEIAANHPGINKENIVMLFFQRAFIPSFKNITFKGIKGVNRLFPAQQAIIGEGRGIVDFEKQAYREDKINQFTDDEELQEGMRRAWIIYVSEYRSRQTGVTMADLVRLCEVSGLIVAQEDQEDHFIVVQTPPGVKTMKPTQWIQQLVNAEKEKEELYKKEHTEEIYVSYDSELLSAYEKIYAETEGSNLAEIIQMKGVDMYHTYSNEIHTINELYGIEAARNYFIIEFQSVLEGAGQYADPRHIILVADIIFQQGSPTMMTFRGLTRQKNSFLSLMSVEQALPVVTKVALMGKKDSLASTSPALMVNRPVPVGTGGAFEIRPDPAYDEIIAQKKAEAMEKVSATDIEQALDDMNDVDYSTISIEGESDEGQNVYDAIFGGGERDEEEAHQSTIVDHGVELPPPQLAPPMIVEPNLVKAQSRLKIPVKTPIVMETVVMEEQEQPPTKKKTSSKKKVAFVAEPEVREFLSVDAEGSEPVLEEEEEEQITPVPVASTVQKKPKTSVKAFMKAFGK